MMENAEATVQTLHRLRESQVGLAIDDFGTGYSSLSYLHRFPTESVKIDRSFVAGMGPRGRDFDIVRTIIDLARTLSMRVVAEGIETEAQAAALRAMRCDWGQGYLFSRPQPVEEATRLLLTQPTW
jgi:EAL domain-containing protein (putative c-di-GMP-specific phosphodiesterase class I)